MPSSATSTPELAALADVCARLDSTRIDYMLTGSLAMSYYARPRMTRDINLVIALDAAQVELLTAALGADYHADGAAITAALREAWPWIVIHLASVAKIDLIARKETPYRLAEFERRSRVELAGVSLWIVSIEDLILSKLEWSRDSHSEQQRRDIGQLLLAPHDQAYLHEWAGQLGLTDMLRKAKDERHQP